MDKLRKTIKDYWLLCLICIQPFLDILAFWTRNEKGTAAGYLRLIIMCVLCMYVLVHIRSYKRYIPSIAAVVLVFGLHMINCFRNGYLGFVSDTRRVLSQIYLPVLAICFCCLMDSDIIRDQAVKGIIINFAVETLVLAISYVTGTYMNTYSEGLGIAGWVISDNRCCHSDILASVCVFAAYYTVKTPKKVLVFLIPTLIFALLFTNGTKVCYLTLVAICVCFPIFLIISAAVNKTRFDSCRRTVCIVMAAVLAVSIGLYKVSPRYKMEELKRLGQDKREEQFAAEMDELGYNVYAVTLDDIFTDELLHERFIDYYRLFVFGGVEPLGRNYSFDRIIAAYNGTVNSHVLGDTRNMKNIYVRFIFEDSDFLTRMFGIEYDQIGPDKTADLENDWYAILYYLGYFGLALAIAATLFLFTRIAVYAARNYSIVFTELNFTLLFGFALQLGMAYFSGAVMRRPSASVYVALFIAMIFYSTSDRKVLKA